uniref:Merozoite surface antigen-2c n=1 Tax=Babesia bovis TaxID=5865 RepID=A0A0D6A0J3_BABBO|nr:merozoite surface antigen-2c [Babesia bovis]
MVSFNIITVALCSTLFNSTSASPQEKNVPSKHAYGSHLLFDDMKLFYDVMRSIDESMLKSILEKNFEAVGMEATSATKTHDALKAVKQLIKTDAPFNTSDFDTLDLEYLSGQSNEELFKLLIEAVYGMEIIIDKTNSYVGESVKHSNNLDSELRKYYWDNIYDDQSEYNKDKLINLYKAFITDSGALRNASEELTKFETKKVQKEDYRFINPSSTSEPESPSPSSGETTAAQPPQTAETPRPAGSSFTIGGLTVATLCYFVLSAF